MSSEIDFRKKKYIVKSAFAADIRAVFIWHVDNKEINYFSIFFYGTGNIK